MNKFRLISVTLMLAFALVLGGYATVSAQASKIVLTWAEYAAPGDDRYVQLNQFIKRVQEETNNRVTFKMYPAEQLVKEIQSYDAMINGTIDIMAINTSYFGGKLPLLGYAFETAYWEPGDGMMIISRLKKEINEIFEKDGIVYLGWGPALPSICLAGPKIFKTFEDLKGLKVRCAGIMVRTMTKWGGTGINVPNSEIYMALQRKLVDATYNTIATHASNHMWEVAKAITFNRSGGCPALTIMNKAKWESLPSDVKMAINKVSREMPPLNYLHEINYTKETEKFLSQKFQESYKLSKEENKIWMDAMKGYLWQPLVAKLGEPAKIFWDKWEALANECAMAREKGSTPAFF